MAITISIPVLLVAMLLFGFAPGAVLRVIVLAFPPDDPRRKELRAELAAVPRLERPLWVAEQIEVAIAEGLFPRAIGIASGRIIYRWHLSSGVKSHEENPGTYWIPPGEARSEVRPGYYAKLSFSVRRIFKHSAGERMWVYVTGEKGGDLVGLLVNEPEIPRLALGDEIFFRREHIIDLHLPGWKCPDDDEHDPDVPMHICKCCFFTRNEPDEPDELAAGSG
jgi:hypothetical protein